MADLGLTTGGAVSSMARDKKPTGRARQGAKGHSKATHGDSISKASQCDERRRDQALQKICAKASTAKPSARVSQLDPCMSSALQKYDQSPGAIPDQVSLQNFSLPVTTTSLWSPIGAPSASHKDCGTPGLAPRELPLDILAPTADELLPISDPLSMLPADLQAFIARAIRQTIEAEFQQPMRAGSTMSILSDRPSELGPEDFQSRDPGSPAPSQESRLLFLEDGDRGDPDLSNDEGLGPEQPAFTGLFPHQYLSPCFLKPSTWLA